MDKTEFEVLKAKFLKMFANVPIPLRNEIIVLIDDKPLSWNVAYAEIKHESKNAKLILEHLKEIELL